MQNDGDDEVFNSKQSNAEFIRYCELHTYSHGARWRPAAIARLIRLAKHPEYTEVWAQDFDALHTARPKHTINFDRDIALELVEHARKVLR